MDKEEIKQKIKDLSYGIQVHQEQRDFHLAAVKRLEAQLAEAEKPELRVGDYGYFQDALSSKGQDGFVIYAFDGADVLIRQDNRAGRSRMGKEYFRQHLVALLGNIFGDLKALSVPLKEFTVNNGSYQTIKVTLESGMFRFRDTDGFMLIKESEIPAFILNLRRLLFTEAEQEASK